MLTTAPSKMRVSRRTTYVVPNTKPSPNPRQGKIIYIDFSGNSLKLPVVVDTVETQEGYWLATHPQILVHGIGETSKEAARDFMSAAQDLIQELTGSEDRLASHLAAELEYLRSVFVI